MKLNKLSLQTRLNIFILLTLAVAMGMMIFLSLYFYKKHFEQEIYTDFKVIQEAIISSKLYTIKDSQELKEKLSGSQRWCFSPYRKILNESDIFVTKTKPTLASDKVSLSRQINANLWLTLSTENKHLLKGYYTLMQTLFIVLFSILFIAGLIVLWRIKYLIAPLKCLTTFCQEIKSQKNSVTLCYANSKEIDQLYNAITSLLSKNRNLCESKVDLFKEAAHELKAPLAIMQARLSLLQEDKSYNLDKYEKETSADINLMNSKLKELLFLKEIESDMQQDSVQEICMMQQCKEMQEQFKRLVQLKKINIETNWSNSFIVATHSKVLKKVMQVIFENVFLHSRPNSTISVEVFPELKQMVITNELNPEGSQHSSSHIGLKIIERLSQKLHYTFSTSSKDGTFTTTISFHS